MTAGGGDDIDKLSNFRKKVRKTQQLISSQKQQISYANSLMHAVRYAFFR